MVIQEVSGRFQESSRSQCVSGCLRGRFKGASGGLWGTSGGLKVAPKCLRKIARDLRGVLRDRNSV